ncbi:diaminopropionate ammonia-lyase [Defluviimonas sp. SAOS-178_SWC]|uniref:diaminopropionate ammonia-lyase n=1 Tax=Defluviimonas sp. SAOS-178_SWC TaxID=3121287 RepID=UPI003221B0D3
MTNSTFHKLSGPFEGDVLICDRKPIAPEVAAYPLEDAQRAFDRISTWPAYSVTPLISLPGLAADLGLGGVWCKDEGRRLGLASFKAMGAIYASVAQISELLEERTGQAINDRDLLTGQYQEHLRGIYLTCCTDGNHGFSVARAARMMGCGCKIYIPRGVSAAREQALRDEGADVVRIDGIYDEAYEIAARDAAADAGAVVISDSATREYTRIPRLVMAGYSIMVREILDQLDGEVPTHVMLPAGCGGLAGAVMTAFDQRVGGRSPKPIIVEPLSADCVFTSKVAGQEVEIEGDLETIMGGLSCAAVSHVAWPILSQRVAGCLRIADDVAVEAMRALANPKGDDPAIVAGETGGAGLAGLMALAGDQEARRALALDSTARVLIFNCEGATDIGAYRQIVGDARSDELGISEPVDRSAQMSV